MSLQTKALQLVGAVLVAYALLVATHRGEFWPFSIYPMFSQAGTPWTRSLVRQMPNDRNPSWDTTSLQALPGTAFPLEARGINENDVANYVSKTEAWTPARLRGLRSIFAGSYDFSTSLLILRVRGELVDDSVSVTATPLLLFTADTTRLNPSLDVASDSLDPPATSSRSQPEAAEQ